MNPTDEFYRNESCLITPTTGDDERVSLFVGEDPVGQEPQTVDAREVIDALETYLEELEEDAGVERGDRE